MAPLTRLVQPRSLHVPLRRIRGYSSTTEPRSAHSEWYASMLPGMIPVALLGSAVYMGLQLLQSRLDHEKFLDEARDHVRQLEEEVDRLQKERALQPLTTSSLRVPASKWWPW
ncbi:hypothetical protein DEU56DRAFT_149002 [Suillus clintonianus]|uniref:uncharacterized protein n=1 Tax=Suillus clintonianus TaxID=1904413 RepID=UPI001B86BD50|nr:uncharacterized protein DEU56DRAFT_149002 [Suillus clintonianus]KAG2146656.1 hypothetical protein DEU56DRAFT_149002 [Suillus clintonianus]